MLPLESSALDDPPPVEDGGLESSEDDERDDEGETPGVQHEPDRRRVYGWHAAPVTVVQDGRLVHQVIEVGEAGPVDVHREGDDQGHDPGQGDQEGDCGHLPLGGVVDGLEDCVAPV